MFRILKRAPWIAIGAAGAWLFDSTNGEARRRRLRDRIDHFVKPESPPQAPPDLGMHEGRAA
jgi:hypothetical protein